MLSWKVVPSNCPKLGGDFTCLENPPGGGGGWLGRKGSNLRMLESKSSALPLGDAPAGCGGSAPGADPYKASRAGPQTGQIAALPRLWGPVAGAGVYRYNGASRGEGCSLALVRRVAQPGRALRSGRRGRRFESSLSDQFPLN